VCFYAADSVDSALKQSQSVNVDDVRVTNGDGHAGENRRLTELPHFM